MAEFSQAAFEQHEVLLRYEDGACRSVLAQVWYVTDAIPPTPSGEPPSELIELRPVEGDDAASPSKQHSAWLGSMGARRIATWEATREMPAGTHLLRYCADDEWKIDNALDVTFQNGLEYNLLRVERAYGGLGGALAAARAPRNGRATSASSVSSSELNPAAPVFCMSEPAFLQQARRRGRRGGRRHGRRGPGSFDSGEDGAADYGGGGENGFGGGDGGGGGAMSSRARLEYGAPLQQLAATRAEAEASQTAPRSPAALGRRAGARAEPPERGRAPTRELEHARAAAAKAAADGAAELAAARARARGARRARAQVLARQRVGPRATRRARATRRGRRRPTERAPRTARGRPVRGGRRAAELAEARAERARARASREPMRPRRARAAARGARPRAHEPHATAPLLAALRSACAALRAEHLRLRVADALTAHARGARDATTRAADELDRLRDELDATQDKYKAMLTERRQLFNTIQELRGNLRVFCRVRPPSSADEVGVVTVSADGEGVAVERTDARARDDARYTFDKCFGVDGAPTAVFREAKPLVTSVMDGYNVCIFASADGAARRTPWRGARRPRRTTAPAESGSPPRAPTATTTRATRACRGGTPSRCATCPTTRARAARPRRARRRGSRCGSGRAGAASCPGCSACPCTRSRTCSSSWRAARRTAMSAAPR